MEARQPAAHRATRRTVLAALAVASFALAVPALAQTEIKLGHVGEPGSLFQKSTAKSSTCRA